MGVRSGAYFGPVSTGQRAEQEVVRTEASQPTKTVDTQEATSNKQAKWTQSGRRCNQ